MLPDPMLSACTLYAQTENRLSWKVRADGVVCRCERTDRIGNDVAAGGLIRQRDVAALACGKREHTKRHPSAIRRLTFVDAHDLGAGADVTLKSASGARFVSPSGRRYTANGLLSESVGVHRIQLLPVPPLAWVE